MSQGNTASCGKEFRPEPVTEPCDPVEERRFQRRVKPPSQNAASAAEALHTNQNRNIHALHCPVILRRVLCAESLP
jgi:hypothetical protein